MPRPRATQDVGSRRIAQYAGLRARPILRPHQDSEKSDDMIGTLVVSLPSRFTGGAVSIEHHGAKVRVGGSDKSLTFVAFYADCRHEVHPIKEGYRIVLTYNLVLEHNATAAGAPTVAITGLTDTVREFFATPGQARWSGDHSMRGPPDRLVYLLDHEYTQRGLRWNRLKNSDAQRAIALQEVARKLDCEIFLALADVHETWSCEDEYSGYSDFGQRYYGDDDDDDDADESEGGESLGESSGPELTELIDSDVELRHWLGTGGRWKRCPPASTPRSYATPDPPWILSRSSLSTRATPGTPETPSSTGTIAPPWSSGRANARWSSVRRHLHGGESARSPRPSGRGTRSRDRHGATAGAILGERHGTDRKACLVRCHSQSRRKAGRSGRRRCTASTVRPRGTEAEVRRRDSPTYSTPMESDWCRTLLQTWTSEENHEPPQTRLSWMDFTLPSPLPNIVRKRLVGRTGTCWLDPLGTVGMVARAVKADSTARLGKGRDARDGQPL